MKFYLDFEANQFTDRIISIGCITENGKGFYRLVNPLEPITDFITNLTGISDKTVANANDIEFVMKEFYDFILEYRNNEPDFFIVYGDCDTAFLKRAEKDIKDFELANFIKFLSLGLIDYSKSVKDLFGVRQPIGLKKTMEYLQIKSNLSEHNALNDAICLKKLVEKVELLNEEDVENNPFLMRPGEFKFKEDKKPEEPKVYIMTNIETGKEYIFSNLKDLIDKRWSLHTKVFRGKTLQVNFIKKIKKAMRNGTQYNNFYYEVYCMKKEELE